MLTHVNIYLNFQLGVLAKVNLSAIRAQCQPSSKWMLLLRSPFHLSNSYLIFEVVYLRRRIFKRIGNIKSIILPFSHFLQLQCLHNTFNSIVGDTDGGVLLSEKEFLKRKKKALEDQKNRVYVTWINSQGLECRAIGPSSKCFCGHKFRDHDGCNKQKKVHCKMAKCKCKQFEYIPIRGSQDLKCHCKHSYKLHDIVTRKCTKRHPVKGTCQNCHGFTSSFGCACGEPFSSHYTLFETVE